MTLNQLNHPIYFVTGIDTDIGKTYATGYLAQQIMQLGKSVITQKLIQTGNHGEASDIITHRRIMGIEKTPDDNTHLTMPMVLPYPASPHLASRLANRSIDVYHLDACTNKLQTHYDVVLVEGAGGLFVPISDTPEPFFMIDYIKTHHYPVILVTSGRLGSINHTLLSLNALKQHHIEIAMVIYNHIHDRQDPLICQDTQNFLQNYLAKHFPTCLWYNLPKLSLD